MDYKKKYKEALERAKECLQDGTIPAVARDYILEIFPELVESEDEKIRKALIEYFRIGANNNETTYNIENKKILAWLEKQGQGTSWKPTYQQMTELDRVISGSFYDPEEIRELQKQLKSLRK